MRLTKVALYSDSFLGPGLDVINFSLEHSHEDSRFMIRSITGLDAENLVPKYYASSLQTKQRYYEFSLQPRDIVMRIVLNPNYAIDESVSSIRDDLFRAISATRGGEIALHFCSGPQVVARIMGFITRFEVGYFNDLPEVQLTVHCNDPMFRAINPIVLNDATIGSATTVMLGDNHSTAPHGFTFQVNFTANTSSFTIQDKPGSLPEWRFKVTPATTFLSGDRLYFSSEFTNKYLYMMRGTTRTDLIDRIDPASAVWPIIFPGINNFEFINAANFDWSNLTYYAAFWGV